MKLIILIISIFLIGCSNYQYGYISVSSPIQACQHKPVYIDTQFSPIDRDNIEKAIDTWNYVLNGFIKFDIASETFDMDPSEIKNAINNNGVLILKINSLNPIIPVPKINGTVLGFAATGGHYLYLVKDVILDKEIETITLHELGHILGSPDIDGEALMNTKHSEENSRCIDKRSMEEVAKYQNIDPKTLNYCVIMK